MAVSSNRLARAALLILLALGWNAVAHAQNRITCNDADLEQDLTATFEQQGATRVLALKGGIVKGSSQVVARALDSGRPYDQIWLCSGGGLVWEGQEIGKLFSRAKAWVRVPAGFFCASSCTIMTLGGYLRTIDEGANFVVHASSGISSIGAGRIFGGDCDTSPIARACWDVASALLASSLKPCKAIREFEDTADPCAYIVIGEPPRPNQYGIKAAQFLRAAPDRNVFAAFARFQLEDSMTGTLDLLKYYQRMLNDGNERAVNFPAYSTIQSERAGLADIYDSGARNLAQDLAAIAAAAPDQRPAVWQELITQIELYTRRGLFTALEPRSAALGRGGRAALKLLDAMTRCRIQSACFLDSNTVAELGYANFEIK
jgi:hypothetical protein